MLFVYNTKTLMQVVHTCSRIEIAFCMFMPSSPLVNIENVCGILAFIYEWVRRSFWGKLQTILVECSLNVWFSSTYERFTLKSSGVSGWLENAVLNDSSKYIRDCCSLVSDECSPLARVVDDLSGYRGSCSKQELEKSLVRNSLTLPLGTFNVEEDIWWF